MDTGPIETTATSVTMADGIVRVAGKNQRHTAATVDETFAAIRTLTDNRRVPILFDVTNFGETEPMSWAQFIMGIESVCVGAAVLASPTTAANPPGEFPQLLDSFVVPFRVFLDEAQALEFLEQFKTG